MRGKDYIQKNANWKIHQSGDKDKILFKGFNGAKIKVKRKMSKFKMACQKKEGFKSINLKYFTTVLLLKKTTPV